MNAWHLTKTRDDTRQHETMYDKNMQNYTLQTHDDITTNQIQ
jgi:hypothetical protein